MKYPQVLRFYLLLCYVRENSFDIRQTLNFLFVDYITFSEDTTKRMSQKNKDFKDVEKASHIPFQDRSINCKPNWKIILVIIILGTLLTIFHPPAVYNTDHISNSISRPTFVNNWKGELDGTDPRYASFLNIDWNQITNVLENLKDKDTYQGVGLLNFNDSEIDHWKQLVLEACSPSPELCF